MSCTRHGRLLSSESMTECGIGLRRSTDEPKHRPALSFVSLVARHGWLRTTLRHAPLNCWEINGSPALRVSVACNVWGLSLMTGIRRYRHRRVLNLLFIWPDFCVYFFPIIAPNHWLFFNVCQSLRRCCTSLMSVVYRRGWSASVAVVFEFDFTHSAAV